MPTFLAVPTADEAAKVYPKKALRARLPGHAIMNCKISVEGDLEDCVVAEETPADEGFGGAALKLAHLFRARPRTIDGTPVAGGEIKVPIRFSAQ
jgi:protein TonB